MDFVYELFVRWAYHVVRCAYNNFAQYAKRIKEVHWAYALRKIWALADFGPLGLMVLGLDLLVIGPRCIFGPILVWLGLLGLVAQCRIVLHICEPRFGPFLGLRKLLGFRIRSIGKVWAQFGKLGHKWAIIRF